MVILQTLIHIENIVRLALIILVGIGGGSACTTSANVAVHYPMALISECYEISKEFDNPTKIIADGGFKTILIY
jgi:hypothetical protein